jgi:hypothetical protein
MNKRQLSKIMAELGRRGGKQRAKNMTPEQRSAAMRKAVQARWKKSKKKNS